MLQRSWLTPPPPSTVVLPFMVHLALFHMVHDLSRAARVDPFPKMDAGSIWWVWARWDGPSAKCPASAKGPARIAQYASPLPRCTVRCRVSVYLSLRARARAGDPTCG